MQEFEIVLTQETLNDLDSITRYIEREFSFEDGEHFQDKIEKEFERLTIFPKAYIRTHYFYREYHIYMKVFFPSLIFYVVKEEEKEIHILRVIREDRDWKWVIENTDKYTYPDD